MEKVRKAIHVTRENGVRLLIMKIWRHLLFKTTISSILQPIAPDFHKEQLKTYDELGYWPNPRNPQSFNEKILHRKLYTNNNGYAKVADKYQVRSYVAKKVSDDILTELYYVTKNPDTICFEELPNAFVIKATHGWGWNILVENKNEEDFEEIRDQCWNWLNQDFGQRSNEYWYLDIEPQIIVEEYIRVGNGNVPKDFKFFIFDGDVKMIEVDVDRNSEHKQKFYTPEWETIDIKRGKPIATSVDQPPNLSDMITIAEKLGNEFDFVRVDLYNPAKGRIIFGELTLAPGAGHIGFHPSSYDFKLGSEWPNPSLDE